MLLLAVKLHLCIAKKEMMVRTFQELLHGSHRAVKSGHGGPLDFELKNILKIIEALQNTESSKNVLFKKTGD